jgi:sugar phosphate isomerase/epimerase
MRADRLAIDFISMLGMPPLEFVAFAAEVGCPQITLAPAPMTANPHGYPAWSLADDAGLRRDLHAALRASGVELMAAEGYFLRPGAEAADAAGFLDLWAELGAPSVNTTTLHPDRQRSVDELGAFADLAAARGLKATFEFLPGLAIGNLASAVTALGEIGRANLSLTIDAMHFFRSGGVAAELAQVDPSAIGYVQLCDVPAAPTIADYGHEALHERLTPGEGELPLQDFLAALPREVPVGLEIPMLSRAQRGVGPRERLDPAIAAARDLLSELTQTRELQS